MYKMIRILPMDKDEEFGQMDINDVQLEFFIKDLPNRKDENGYGKYCYKKQGLVIKEQPTLVLFQYSNKIIACADLTNVVKFEIPKGIYKGALYFEPTSIKIFNPIDNEEVNSIFHCSIKFGQIKYKLDAKYVKNFFSKIKNVKQV